MLGALRLGATGAGVGAGLGAGAEEAGLSVVGFEATGAVAAGLRAGAETGSDLGATTACLTCR